MALRRLKLVPFISEVSVIAVRVLGPMEVTVDGVLVSVGGPRQRCVLARLIAARGQVVSVDRIIEDLYAGEAPPGAHAAVQSYVSRLRRALEPGRAAWAHAEVLVSSAADASAQSQQLQGGTQVFYGAGAEGNADSIASMAGAQAATSLSSLPARHVEVLLGQQVIAQPPGLETFGATTVTEQDFVTAAQQNNLPASEVPTATGTQSVSATEVGARAVAPVQPGAPAHPASTPSAANVKRPADVPAGIPCGY